MRLFSLTQWNLCQRASVLAVILIAVACILTIACSALAPRQLKRDRCDPIEWVFFENRIISERNPHFFWLSSCYAGAVSYGMFLVRHVPKECPDPDFRFVNGEEEELLVLKPHTHGKYVVHTASDASVRRGLDLIAGQKCTFLVAAQSQVLEDGSRELTLRAYDSYGIVLREVKRELSPGRVRPVP